MTVRKYKYWLTTYTRRLTEEADIGRLTELCQFLLGPPSRNANKNWEPSVLGMSKRELLRSLLPIMSTNRGLQRVVAQFREGLEATTKTDQTNFELSSAQDNTEAHKRLLEYFSKGNAPA